MKDHKRKLGTEIGVYMAVCLVLAIGLSSAVWLYFLHLHYERELAESREVFMEVEKEKIRTVVENSYNYIKYMRSLSESRLKKRIRDKVQEAYGAVEFIYDKYKDKESNEQIIQRLHDTLYALSWDNGRGYFFAESTQGIELINRNNSEIEGTNISDLQDNNGVYIVREIIKIAEEKGEGFLKYHWSLPGGDKSKHLPKFSYVKLFKPLNIIIGTGAYLQYEEDIIRKEVIARLRNIKIGKMGYIFAFNKDKLIIHPELRNDDPEKSLRADPKLTRSFTESINNSDGFVKYFFHKPGRKEQIEKISFSIYDKRWDWYIGYGVFFDELNANFMKQSEDIKKTSRRHLLYSGITVLLLILVSFVIAKIISLKVTRNLNLFAAFFEKAATEDAYIPQKALSYSDFCHMAQTANDMISQRSDLLHQQQRMRSYLSNIINSMPSALLAVNAEGRITQVNIKAPEVMALPERELIGKKIVDICKTAGFSTLKISWALKENRQLRIDGIKRVVAGKELVETLTLYPLCDEENTGAVIRIDDVTEQHSLEQELAHSRRMEAVGRLAGGIAHDFNNMLGGIINSAELIKAEASATGKKCNWVDMIITTSERAAQLIKKLLQFSQNQSFSPQPLNLAELIERTRSKLQDILGEEVSLTLDLLDRHLCSNADEEAIENMLEVFASNSSQAMPEGGSFMITAKAVSLSEDFCSHSSFDIKPGRYAQLQVADTGEGIDEAVIARIFEPFFSTREQGEGAGLGLAAAYGTVVQHNGAVTVNSSHGSGSTFTVYLPLNELEYVCSPIEGAADEAGQGGQKVLLVDDENFVLHTSRLILERAGYDVLTADSGEEAVELYQDKHTEIKVVILDMNLPNMDGAECLEKLVAIDSFVKVVIASADEREPQLLPPENICGYLLKPYHAQDLLRVIEDSQTQS